ncbi:MAG: hypothetical protein IJ176_05860 [Prevotella sp.]|nr:hypothetical protein [Prevotella sp.]
MKQFIYQALTAAFILAAIPFAKADAKRVAVPQVYVFGMAASFNDSIVYFTDIQTLANAWVDSKSRFLQSRDIYSYQLREHLAQKLQMPHRTCIVFYAEKLQKLQKKYDKLKRLYANPKPGSQQFDVRSLTTADFRFEVIDLSDEIALEEQQEAELEQQKQELKAQKKQKKQKKSASKEKKEPERGKTE